MYFLSILLPSISPSRNCENNSAIDKSYLAGLAYQCFITLALSRRHLEIENYFQQLTYNSGVNERKMRALWQTRLKFCKYGDIRISIQILPGDTFVE